MSYNRTNQSQNLLILLLKTLLILSIFNLSRTNSVCPSSAYVSVSDASSYGSAICSIVAAYVKYRIQGGASVSCAAGSPNVIPSDPDILTQALCITFTTTPGGSVSSTTDIPIKRTQPPGCPADYIQATYLQALKYKNEICSAIGYWDIVALQGGGSIRGRGYGCAITQTETTGMGDVACVPQSYVGPVTTATVNIVDVDENVCSSCQSLITAAEADTYYTSIPVGTTAQIAGGSSVQRTSISTFSIIDHDATSRSNQICATIPRAGCLTSSYLTPSCTCEACSNECTTCLEAADKCTSCSSLTSTPFLSENKCVAQCPTNICPSQPENDHHFTPTSSELPRITRIFSKTSNIGFTVGAAFSNGPMAIFTGLLFKLIGYIKYLDIAYPNNLEQAFQKWHSDIIPSVFPEIPNKTKNKLEAKQIPAVYLERKVAPTFLENFWFPMLNLAVSFFSLGCLFLAVTYCRQKGKKNAEVILKYLQTGLLNFIIVHLYYHYGDILFFFILETRSIDFGSGLSVVSFCTSIIFLGIAICALTLHSFILFKAKNAQKLGKFEDKHSRFKILFYSFKDSSFLSSSYLLLFILRDVALNLVVALLFEHTLVQAVLFTCVCAAFMSYLIIMRPCKRTLENIMLCFFESLVFFTYIFALLIRAADTSVKKDRFGMIVIVMAFVFSVVSTILMVYSLIRMGLHFYKEQEQRKALKKIHILPENSQTIQQNRGNAIKNSTFLVETNDSLRALDASPVRSIRGSDKNETTSEPSFSKDLSLAERIQIKRSQGDSYVRREKKRLELFNNSPSANEQGKTDKSEKLQLDKSIIQEESDQTSRSLSNRKFEKRDSSRLYTNPNLSNHLNSINSISYTKLPSNAESPENKFAKFHQNFTPTDNRIIDLSPDKDLPITETQNNQLLTNM